MKNSEVVEALREGIIIRRASNPAEIPDRLHIPKKPNSYIISRPKDSIYLLVSYM